MTWAQRYGLKAGLNVSDVVITNYINADAESDYQMKTGVHGGFYGDVNITEKISLAAELMYSNKGVKAADRINLHYINIPLLTLYHITDKFLAELGPELGYLLMARSRHGNVGNTWNNKLDVGLDAGIRIIISDKLMSGLRYYAGFSSVIDSIDESGTNNVPSEEAIKYQNRVLQLSLYYNLGEIGVPRK
jgi:hypothetical protein